MLRPLVLAAAWLAASCSPSEPAATAPDPGVCWRVRGADGEREVLERGIANLATCAQRLEAVRMMEGADLEGVFEGRRIYVTEAEITQAATPGGKRYPVFDPQQRREVQAAIRTLLDRRKAGEAGG